MLLDLGVFQSRSSYESNTVQAQLEPMPPTVICRSNWSHCNTVCVDNNCSQEINNAIKDLHEKGGGTVFVMDGTYPIDNPGILPLSNVTLIGQSWNTVLKGVIKQNDLHLIYINGTEDSYLENIKISNIHLDGSQMKSEKAIMANYVRNLLLTDIWVSAAARTCIGPDWVENFMIVNNLVENCNLARLDGNGIGIGGTSSDGLISNNIVRNVSENTKGEYGIGILLERLGGGPFHRNIIISNNLVSHSKDAFGLMGAEDVVINSNMGYSNIETGLTSGVTGLKDISISDNRFENNTNGIYISSELADKVLVSENVISGNSLHGLVFRGTNSTIGTNTIHGNNGSGIYLVDFRSLVPSFNRFEDNQIYDNSVGIEGRNVTNSLFLDNMIYNNDIAVSFDRNSSGLVERNFCKGNLDEPDKELHDGALAWEC